MSDNNTSTPTTPVQAESSVSVGETLNPTQASEAIPNSTGPVAEGQDPGAQEAVEEHKAEVAKKIRKLKLKVDGKEFEEELPFEIDDTPEAVEYMRRELQLSKASSKRMSEASEYKKQLDGVGKFLAEVKSNPAKFRELAKELEIDEKALAAAIIEEEIERSKKSPEQLEKEKLETELRQLKEDREQEKKNYEEKELKRYEEQETERYDKLISEAVEKSDLPKSPYVVKKVVSYLAMALQEGIDVSPQDVLPLVREEIQNDIREMFSVMPEEVIEGIVGKDTLKRLRKRNIAQAAPAAPVSKTVQDTGKTVSNKQPEKKISFRDYFKM